MKRILLLWFVCVVTTLGQVTPGISEADLLKAKGAPVSKVETATRVFYRWTDMLATVEGGKVTKVVVKTPPPPAPNSAGPAGPAQPSAPPAPNFQTPWQDESTYVITQIGADLAEMAYYLKFHEALPVDALHVARVMANPPSPKVQPGTDLHYVFRVIINLGGKGTVQTDVAIASGIFLPANYLDLTHALFTQLDLSPPLASPTAASDVLRQLTEPDEPMLTRVDKYVSSDLVEHFGSAATHEEAALLLTAFALKENSDLFHQIRVELCRTTAHLTFAEALRHGPSTTDEGRIAGAALALLYGNEALALERLNFESARPETHAWQRALRMRITKDFRPLEDQSAGTLFERLEWFRARCDQAGVAETFAVLQQRPEWENLADWTRTMAANHPSVQVGHYLMENALRREIVAWRAVYPTVTGRPVPADAVGALNELPRRCVSVEGVHVLGWGLWSASLQRHLCSMISCHYHFLSKMYGDQEKAAQFREQMDKIFDGLTLYPFVRRQMADDERYYRAAQQAAQNLLRRDPQVVPAQVWNYICYETDFCPLWMPPPGHPFINEWHRQNPLPGTVYDILPRLNHPSMVNRMDPPHLEELHRLAPYNEYLSYYYLGQTAGQTPSAAAYLRVYAPLIDYSPGLAETYAELPDVSHADKLAYLHKAAQWRANAHLQIAELLVSDGHEAEAAAEYRQWLGAEPDRVAAANGCLWLVQYLEMHGEPRQAMEVANEAAETGSARGLLTKSWLLESRGDFDGALELCEDQAARYGRGKEEILGCAMRAYAQTGKPKYKELRDRLMGEVAPEGLPELTPELLSKPPTVGAFVHTDRWEVTAAGLKKGDVIVGQHGYLVMNFAQYKIIRGLYANEPIRLKIWRDGKYLDLPPLKPGYRFGVDLQDYRR